MNCLRMWDDYISQSPERERERERESLAAANDTKVKGDQHLRAVVVAQLTARLLPIREDRGSIPVIGNFN